MPSAGEHSSLWGKSMKLPRRHFLHLAAGAAALPAMLCAAASLDYPTRPVRIVVGFAPGGATDIAARLIGQWLSDRLGQPFAVHSILVQRAKQPVELRNGNLKNRFVVAG
jgi:hypothetical protein